VWFLSSIQFTSIAGACASWYFSIADKNGRKQISYFLLSGSLIRVLSHHLGTMAFGSLIISIVITLKFIAVYMITQVQNQSPENKLIQILGNCLKVVVNCVDRFIRFLGQLAYIETAIYGTHFCRSLLKAFVRLVKNVVRFAFVTLFSKLVLFLGKVGVVVVSVWLSMLAMELAPERPNNVSASIPLAPLALTALASGIIAFAIMGVYETAIDTIMVSFLEDEAENDAKGSISFASGELKQFMSGTKSIADAEEEYVNAVRNAKTNKIRAGRESEKAILQGAHGKAAQKKRRAQARKRSKRNKKQGKKKNASNEKDVTQV